MSSRMTRKQREELALLVLSVIETRPLLIRAIADAILDELHAVENAIAAASRVQ